MDIFIFIIGIILTLIGLIGCILPVIPGPPFAYAALLLGYLTIKPRYYSLAFILIMAGVVIAVTIMDYVFPSLVSKRYGASKYGSWGAMLGLLIGMIFFPPFGIFIGAFLGAILGELIFRPDVRKSLKAGWGVIIGILLGTFLKTVTTGIIGYFFIKEVLPAL